MMTNAQLTPKQFDEFKESIVEHIVDNMDTNMLVDYVTSDLLSYYDSLTLNGVIDEAKLHYNEDDLEELITLCKEDI